MLWERNQSGTNTTREHSSKFKANVQPINNERLSKTSADQHFEGIVGFHRWRGSSHRVKTKMEIKMCRTFMEIIMNQSTTMTHRCAATRINVKAKEVFPNAHDIITKGCDTKLSRATSRKFFGFCATYSRCRPRPLSAATVKTAAYAIRSIFGATVRKRRPDRGQRLTILDVPPPPP